MITVLVLASSPTDQGSLRLGKEHKEITHSLNSASNRDQFRIASCMASTVDDLRRYLLEHSPDVVHFCGHGAGPQGLCFEDDGGRTHQVSGERLAKLFHLVNDTVRCVVLNACFSEDQARTISEHIDFVIGMKDAIGDAAAIKFALGFYQAVWAGQSYEKAFKFGCSAIDTAGIPQEHVPVILRSPRLGGDRLEYSEDTQRIENFLLRYVKAGPEGRAALSVDGERVAPLVAEAMRGEVRPDWTSVAVRGVGTVAATYKEVAATVRAGLEAVGHTFYLKPSGDSFLVDWEATMGHWPIPFRTFKALGCRKPLRVRVTASLSDYFNYGYDKDEWVSVKLEHISRQNIHGYINLSHPACVRLVNHLLDGKEHRVILDILPGEESTSCVTITGFVNDSWVVTRPQPEIHSERQRDGGPTAVS